MLHFFFQGQFSLTFLPAILIGAVAVRWVGLEGMDFFFGDSANCGVAGYGLSRY